MGDFPGNPYLNDPRFQLSDEQMRQYRLGSIGDALTNLGAGIAMGGASGRPWYTGIAPGAAMASNAMNQQGNELAKMQMGAAQYQTQEDYRKAEMEKLGLQTKQMQMDQDIYDKIVKGMGVQPAQPGMGPAPADLQKAGPPIVNYLMSQHGLSPQAAAGVAGNLYQESGFNPNAVGDGGKSKGIAQWDPERYAGLQKFAAAAGGSPADPKIQIDYMMAEMKNGDMGAQRAYAQLQQAKTPAEAATAMLHFERPQGYTPANPQGSHGYVNRVQYAQALMPGAVQPGQTASALPAFQGPGMPSIQPGALPPGMPPQMVAQTGGPQPMPQGGDNGMVAPGQPQPAQYTPPQASNGPPGASAGIDPTTQLMLMTPRFAPLGQARLTNQTQQFQQELERQKFQYQQQQDAERQAVENANKDVRVDPVTHQPVPNDVSIEAKAKVQAAQGLEAKKLEMEYGASKTLADAEMQRYSKDVRPGIEATAANLPNLYEIKRLTDGPLAAGPMIDKRMLAARTLDWLGLNDMPGDMVNRAEYNNRAGKNTLAFLQTRALGSGSGISEGDRRFVESLSGRDSFSTEELKRLADIGIQSAQRSIDQHNNQIVPRMRKLPGVGNIDPEYFNIPSLSYADYVKANPPLSAPSAAPPAAPAGSLGMPGQQPPAEDLYKRYNLKPAK